MKNTSLFVMLLLGGGVAFTSCSDDDDDYTMGNQSFVTEALSGKQ